MGKVLVIIVTYNAMKWIDRCLNSLYSSSIPVDIFIVDNCSSDGTVEHIKADHRCLKLVESKFNLGFGKANNLGFEFAKTQNYEYIYLLNQDAWVFEHTFRDLIEVTKLHKEFGVLSPMQMNDGCKKLDHNFLLCCPRVFLSDLYCKDVKHVYETEFVMAAHWMITRKCLLKIGGFSPSFPHYGEDHNYLHRVRYFGFKIGIVPKTFAIHDREYRVDTELLKIKKSYIQSVVQISNINNSLLKNLLLQPTKLIGKGIKLLSFVYLKNSFTLMMNYPRFIKNRKESKSDSFLKRIL